MTKYIDKDALVAEIEKRLDELWDLLPNASDVVKDNYTKEEANITGKYTALESFEKFINTLEVKEVNLEKEFNNFLDNIEDVPRMWHSDEQIEWGKDIARHFFELGLNTQQNINIDITNIDKIIEENGVDPNSKEAKMFKESYYIALERLKVQKGE